MKVQFAKNCLYFDLKKWIILDHIDLSHELSVHCKKINIKKYNLDKIWVILYGPKFILHPHIPLLLFGISLWKLCHFYFNDNRGESQMIVTLLVLWRLRYSLQRVEPVEELPVELLDKTLMATWTIVHLASELVDLPWDSSVVLLAASPSAPRDALLVR